MRGFDVFVCRLRHHHHDRGCLQRKQLDIPMQGHSVWFPVHKSRRFPLCLHYNHPVERDQLFVLNQKKCPRFFISLNTKLISIIKSENIQSEMACNKNSKGATSKSLKIYFFISWFSAKQPIFCFSWWALLIQKR